MKLSDKQHYILTLIFISFISILFLLAFFNGLKDQNIDLSKTKKKHGIVENFETEIHLRNKGQESTAFYIKFIGLEKRLKVGRVFGNYDDLIETIKNGDSLTIYCKENEEDFSVIEIQRASETLLHKYEYEKRSSIILIIAVLGIISCLYIIYKVRKHYKENLKSSN